MMIINDFKYAVRLLSKKPGFTILTTLVMATGIGLSVFLFSFLNTLVFKPLPFEGGDSIVQLSTSQNGVRNVGTINLHDYLEIKNNVKGLTEFGAFRDVSLNVSGRDGTRRYSGIASEPNIFQITRTQPLLGRGFLDADNQVGAQNVIIIGYDVWQNQFGGDAQIVDQSVRVNGENYKIIGVMPQGYYFPYTAELWIPLREDPTRMNRGTSGDVFGLAHLEKNASMDDVNREISVVMQRLQEKYPKTNNGVGAYIEYIPMTGVEDGAPVLFAMQVIVFLILILASINVGSLLLSRAIERGKETAIRVALGAPRSRLISQMLWESIIICTLGGIIGLLVLAWGLEVTESTLTTFNPDRPNFWWKFGIDAYTIEIFLLFVITTILVTGLLPAWRNSGSDFNAVLRDGTRGALGKKAGRLNRALVICEIFVSMTVLIAAGVMAVSNYMTTRADYGADPDNVMTAQVLLTESKYDTAEKQNNFVKALESRLENSEGIGDVMISSALPGEFTITPTMALEGQEYTEDKGYPRANYIAVTPASMEKLGIELKSGRYFNTGDDGLDKKTVIVTESFASRYFNSQSPIGKRIRIVGADGEESEWLSIVGVVEHTIQGAPVEESGKTPSVFRPFSQEPRNQVTVAMKTKGDSSEAVHSLRETLSSIDPEMPAFRVEPYQQIFHRISAPMLFGTSLFLIFGMAAAVLASSGLYGVMSNTVNQRTQEIGVKRALGAPEQRIISEFLRKGANQLLWGGIPGLLAGCAMGFGMAQTMGIGNGAIVIIALLFTVIIGGVVMLASYLPTKRALRMEPAAALRYE
jgi:putative ABC transport system permease protein